MSLRVMAGALLALLWRAPLATSVTVPDPTWIEGFYDAADGDEAAMLVWDRSSAAVPAAAALVAPVALLVAPLAVAASARRHPLRRSLSRAPPTA